LVLTTSRRKSRFHFAVTATHERSRVAPGDSVRALEDPIVAGRDSGGHSRGTQVIVVDATVVAGFLFSAEQILAQFPAVAVSPSEFLKS
jgi:hypothetical protein